MLHPRTSAAIAPSIPGFFRDNPARLFEQMGGVFRDDFVSLPDMSPKYGIKKEAFTCVIAVLECVLVPRLSASFARHFRGVGGELKFLHCDLLANSAELEFEWAFFGLKI